MVEQKNSEKGRRAWVRPELKQINAGAAEAGHRVNEDGGDAIAGPRS